MRMRTSAPLLYSAVAFLAVAPALGAQGRIVHQGSFVVSRGTEVIGKETYVLREGRQSGSLPGLTLTVHAHYPAQRAQPLMVTTIEIRPDSQMSAARLDLFSDSHPSIFVAVGPRRTTVRTITPRGESARQHPSVPRTLVQDEFLFAAYTVLPGQADGMVGIMHPRTNQRSTVPLRNEGMDQTAVHGVTLTLRHITVGSGDDTRDLWYDQSGRLVKVAMPSQRLVAVRAPGR